MTWVEQDGLRTSPVAKITTNLEPCIIMLLEKLQKQQLIFGRLLSLSATYIQGPSMLRQSGEISCAAQNTHAHCSIVSSVNSAHISTYTETTQTLLT